MVVSPFCRSQRQTDIASSNTACHFGKLETHFGRTIKLPFRKLKFILCKALGASRRDADMKKLAALRRLAWFGFQHLLKVQRSGVAGIATATSICRC
jgi:hypothetical protein